MDAVTRAPEFSGSDKAYIEAEYRTLDQLCATRETKPELVRDLIRDGKLPAATYVLSDGREMFPMDYFELVDEAGSPDNLRLRFDQRYRDARVRHGLDAVDGFEDWQNYLSGLYGVCLRQVTPETIVEKESLIAQIRTLTEAPRPEDPAWTQDLTTAVDRLDALERPFTDYDRERWGGTSRDSHITAIRAAFLR